MGARRQSENGASILERLVGLVGLLLVIAAPSLLLYESFSREPSPPDIVVRAAGVQPLQGHYLLRFIAENRGGATGAQVPVVAELADAAGRTLARRQILLDYVPAHSRQEGGLYFPIDPRRHRLRLYVEGYAEP